MSEWKTCTLNDLGTIVGGATPSTKKPENYDCGTIAWITPKDLASFSGRFISKGERNITEVGLKSCSTQLMPAHTVLFSSRAPIGYVAIAQQEVCTNQGFKSIVPNKSTDYMFLYYLLKYNKDRIEHLGSGTTFKEISGNTMRGVEVRVPASLDEQRKIASVLSAFDDKIEENDRINKNLEEQAQILVAHYCESNPPKVVLGKILTFVNGFAFQSSSYLPKGTYKVITIKNVQDGKIDSQGAAFINDIPSRMKPECFLHIGDVLLSLTGNVGRVGIVSEENLLLNQRVAKFMPSDASLMPYLYFYFRLPSSKTSLETIAKGTAQQNLSPVETLKLEIPFDETAKELSISMLYLFEEIISNQMQNQKLCDLRDTLLPRLMSGELDVSDIAF